MMMHDGKVYLGVLWIAWQPANGEQADSIILLFCYLCTSLIKNNEEKEKSNSNIIVSTTSNCVVYVWVSVVVGSI